MITKFGKRFITNYLAGNVGFSQKDIAIGIGSTAVNAKGNDTRLEFEFYRFPATLGSIDITQTGTDVDGDPIFTYTVIYKGTIPQDVAGVISEVGLYPSSKSSTNNYDSKFITSFENNLSWIDTSNANPALKLNDDATSFYAKIGENMVWYTVPASTAKEYKNTILSFDLSGYSVNDSLSIAYKKADNNTSKIRVKLYSSSTSYYYADFTPSGVNGDKIQSVSMSTVFTNSVGTPDATNITQIGVEVTAGSGGTTNIYFDGIRINDEDTFDPQYGLISRYVFSSGNELKKTSGRAVDIEYKLQLGF
jgi:hypothetical protein